MATVTLLDLNIGKKRKVDEEIEVGIGVRRVFFFALFPSYCFGNYGYSKSFSIDNPRVCSAVISFITLFKN